MAQYRVFVAAAYQERDRAIAAATMLHQDGGHMICSTWHTGAAIPGGDAGVTDRTKRQEICEKNRVDLRKANVFVLLLSPHCQGSLVEFGRADSAGDKKLYAVGDPLKYSLMLDCRWVNFVDSIEQVVAALAVAQ